MNTFWSQGFTGTSISDLLEATQLSRSSLYQTFHSKESLFESCLAQYCDELSKQLRSKLEQAECGRAFITEAFLDVAQQAESPVMRQGCFAMNTAIELGHTESRLAKLVEQGLAEFAGIFTDAVRQAQQEGDIADDQSAEDLGRYLVCSMGGLRMLIKSGASPAQAKRTAELILRTLD